jgi:excinuclease ABC subunit A
MMHIHVQGANANNLKGVDADFGEGLTVVTGVSGSGKTSLAFDTLYHEARRRFLEVLALGSTSLRLPPAEVRAITGLGPAVAVGQNLLNRNPNSTLASATGLHLFLRMLFAHFGQRHCPACDAAVTVLSEDEIVERLLKAASHRSVRVFVPLLRGVSGSHRTLLRLLSEQFGSQALRVDGRSWPCRRLDAGRAHDLDVELAQLSPEASASDVRQTVQSAAALGATAVLASSDGQTMTLARAPVCHQCGFWLGDLRPVHFGTPCAHCGGEGCARCGRTGLHPQAAAVRLQGKRLPEWLACSVDQACARFAQIDLPSTAVRLRKEIERRLLALQRVGLGYITLDRSSPSLSRGEAQRVRLAVALTSELEDMLHVLDEPTIGQHPLDVARLLPELRRLQGPVVYVEHDRLAASVADHAIDLGPGAGREGGRVLFSGTAAQLWEAQTATGRHFSLRERVAPPQARPEPEQFLTILGASLYNLADIDVPIPLGRLTAVTGVSGSGKSSLVEGVLVPSLLQGGPVGCAGVDGPALKAVMVDQSPIGHNPRSNAATYTKLSDVVRDLFARETGLSASHFSFNRPEGACPACKGMGAIEVQMRYLPSTWMPCAACNGRRFSDEVLAVQVSFGDRALSIADFFEQEVAEALPLLAGEARLPESSRRRAVRILRALRDVGLGYLTLGQPSPTLSGGEAQRVKLAKYLGRSALARQMLVLDEPTTGLHPQDVAALLVVLDRLVRRGATIVVVEHNADVIRSADWVVDLGPGAGPEGGRVVYAGPVGPMLSHPTSHTGRALLDEASIEPLPRPLPRPAARSPTISVRDARMHNLKGVNVDFPKRQVTAVTGVSGSGKSSLVADVLEAEARRRFLETLSLYERQATHEGAEALVGSLTGLGVALAVGTERRLRYDWRATVGTATEISRHLAVLLSLVGKRRCLECDEQMERGAPARQGGGRPDTGLWQCPACGATAPMAQPRHFSPRTYAAACLTCHGVGHSQVPRPEKLITHPEKPLCAGAMHSPGFFPKGYLCRPGNHGYDMTRALGERHGFDAATTPWCEMTPQAQQAFLFGDPQPIEVTFRSRTRTSVSTVTYPGFYGWIRDWDVGGMYTEREVCPDCQGTQLRPEYLAVTLGGWNLHELSEMPLSELAGVMAALGEGVDCASATGSRQPAVAAAHSGRERMPNAGPSASEPLAEPSLRAAQQRLAFLVQVGLGYLHLNRRAGSLSAGEAQRIRLAALLGSGLTSLTVLLDEPSRGLHPSELQALLKALQQLRDEGNTVIVVEHDPLLITAADHVIELGPGPGANGGLVVAQGAPAEIVQAETVTGAWLRGERRLRPQDGPNLRFEAPDGGALSSVGAAQLPSRGVAAQSSNRRGWLEVRGARQHNLHIPSVRFPLGALVGVCGVSGSGKSSLLIDTLGRALAPRKLSTSVAYEPLEPGAHDAIHGAPGRVVMVDQALAGVTTPADFLRLTQTLRRLYSDSDDAHALGVAEKQLERTCSACDGRGVISLDMGFLPTVRVDCETCQGTGFRPEAWEVRLRGMALPEVFFLTIDAAFDLFGDVNRLGRTLAAARQVGLGYLVLRQPRHALSGGEAQRLKIARELARKTNRETLYILDEPTVGQHLEDVARLAGVLRRLVEEGHSVLVIEHHPHLLASCDWLVELGPGGGPDGGEVIAYGTPQELAAGATPMAPYLRQVLAGAS